MKVVKKKNQEVYKYLKHDYTDGTRVSILFFILAILFLAMGVLISYLSNGEGGTIVGGFALSSIICDVSALIYIIKEIYSKHFYPEVRNLLVLSVAFLVMWIIII